MNNIETVESALKAILDQYIYEVSSSMRLSKRDSINKIIIPIIIAIIKSSFILIASKKYQLIY